MEFKRPIEIGSTLEDWFWAFDFNFDFLRGRGENDCEYSFTLTLQIDKLIWSGEHSRFYSMRSGYKVLVES